jgi:hypothetical protein
VGFYVFQILIIVFSAAIPAAVAIGAPASTAGVPGALLTAPCRPPPGISPGGNWIRFSSPLVDLQREVVAWSVEVSRTANRIRRMRCSAQVESLVITETGQWSALRTAALSGQADSE